MPWIASLIGGLQVGTSAMAGQQSVEAARETNVANAQQAALNRQWMTQMSDTAMTRRVQDLKNANLNPLLAIGAGGASTPTSSQAVMQSPGSPLAQVPGAISGAVNSAAQIAQTQQTKAQTDKTLADTRQVNTQTDTQIPAQVKLLGAQYGLTNAQATVANNTVQAAENKAFWDSETAHNDMLISTHKAAITNMDEQTQRAVQSALIAAQQKQLAEAGASAQNVYNVQNSAGGQILTWLNALLKPAIGAAQIIK